MLEKEIYIEKHEWFTQQQIEHLAPKIFHMSLYGLKKIQMQGIKKLNYFINILN